MAEGEMGHFSVILQATINWEVSLFSSSLQNHHAITVR